MAIDNSKGDSSDNDGTIYRGSPLEGDELEQQAHNKVLHRSAWVGAISAGGIVFLFGLYLATDVWRLTDFGANESMLLFWSVLALFSGILGGVIAALFGPVVGRDFSYLIGRLTEIRAIRYIIAGVGGVIIGIVGITFWVFVMRNISFAICL